SANRSDDLENLAAAGEVEVGVALHLRAELFVGRVFLHRGFELADVCRLVLEHDAVEVAGHIGQHTRFARHRRARRRVLQLSSQFAGAAWLGDEAVSHDDHDVLLNETDTRGPILTRTGAGVRGARRYTGGQTEWRASCPSRLMQSWSSRLAARKDRP